MTFFETVILEAFRRGDDPAEAVRVAREALNQIEKGKVIDTNSQ